MAKVTIWGSRTSVAKGSYQNAERQCDEADAQAWLAIFRADEPNVCFVASKRKPKS